MNARISARSFLPLVMIALVVCAPARAQSTPPTQRGFNANTVHDFSGVDSINVFNGNLTAQVPIGGGFSIGDGTLGYALTLNYNSSIWDIEGSGGEVYTAWGNTESLRVKPNRTANAGLGWILTLGELITRKEGADGLAYVDPSGAVHTFYSGTRTIDGPFTFGHTRDTSHVRAKRVAGTPPKVLVETGDGIIREFHCTGCDTTAARWHLREIRDLAGNRLVLEYTLPAPSVGPWNWFLKERPANTTGDSVRTHVISFDRDPNAHPDARAWRVASVQLAGGAQYTLSYGQKTLRRDCVRNPDATYNTPVTLSTLSSVTLPDGSQWQFEYHDDAPDGNCARRGGRLRRIELPAAARIEYEYGQYNFITRVCDQNGSPRPPMQRVFNNQFGVTTKTVSRFEQVLLPGTTEKAWQWVRDGQWIYGQAVDPYESVSVENCKLPKEYRRVVIDALGNRTRYYFSAYLGGDKDGKPWEMLEYGLPFTKNVPPQGAAGREMFFSSETWQCGAPPDLAQVPPPDLFSTAGCTKQRERYLRFETDGSIAESETSIVHTNQRIAGERTLFFESDPSRVTFVDAQHTLYDGVGHYRQTVTASDFAAANGGGRGDARTTFTNYNSSCITNRECTHWLLALYDETRLQEANEAADGSSRTLKRQFTFDATGFPSKERLVADMSAGSLSDQNDLFIERQRTFDSNGMAAITETRRHGLSGAVQFRSRRLYQFGTLQLAAQLPLTGDTMLLVNERNTVDAATGLVTRTEDASAAGTTYGYDLLRRLRTIQRDGEALTTYDYSRALTTSGSERLPSVIATTGAGSGLMKETWRYDALGRLIAHEKRMPGGKTSEKTISWNGMSWKTSESVVGEKGTSRRRQRFEDYDPFGRVGRIVHADHEGAARQSRTRLTYFGTRATRTEIDDGTTSFVARVEKYDAQGRLVAVEEPAPAADSRDTTWYGYHLTGDLGKVVQGTQIRRFVYDGRGYLLSEATPELNNARIVYTAHNAFGKPGFRRHEAAGDALGAGVAFTYDAVGRLTEVRQRLSQDRPGKLLKQYEYYPSNLDPCNPAANVGRAAGKLRSAHRHNFVRDPRQSGVQAIDVLVSETYSYHDVTGRPTIRVTKIEPEDEDPFSFSTAVRYDQLGNVEQVTYPSCVAGNCSGALAPARRVDSVYTEGLLTNVTGYASIGYHPNGLVKQIHHNTGPRDEVFLADDGLPRPSRMFTSAVTRGGWDSETYRYDARGNITEIGPDRYTYDKGNRVTKATVAGVSHDYAYDRWGNLTTYNNTSFLPAAATNRLGGGQASYDYAGNLRSWKDPRRTAEWSPLPFELEHDEFNMVTRMRGPAPAPARPVGRIFVYTADDERVGTFDYQDPIGVREVYFIRGLQNEILREYQRTVDLRPDHPLAIRWSWLRDYVYRGTSILASESSVGRQQFHLDHLGSTRLITDAQGGKISRHNYLPFGEETGSPDTGTRIKFTGHERDDDGSVSQLSDFDYMHARYYAPMLGRFLSIDPVSGSPQAPQSWNRYTYAANNPVRIVDPDGRQNADYGKTLFSMPNAGEPPQIAGHISPDGSGFLAKAWDAVRHFVGLPEMVPATNLAPLPPAPPELEQALQETPQRLPEMLFGAPNPSSEQPAVIRPYTQTDRKIEEHALHGDDHGEGHGSHEHEHQPHTPEKPDRMSGSGSRHLWEQYDQRRRQQEQERRIHKWRRNSRAKRK